MAALSIAFASYKRTGFPPSVALNCLSEKSPTKPTAIDALISRAGLEAFEQVGEAPIRGIYAKSGLLGNRALIVAKNTAYLVSSGGAVTTLSGTIAGDGLVEIDGGLDADGNSVIRIANGSALYRFTDSGTSVVAEDFPSSGGAGASSVAFWAGYWIAVEAGTDFFYYQIPASTTWTQLEFAAAEYAPDALGGVRTVGDLAALLGSATTEFWGLTGDSSNPLQKQGGLAYDVGCKNIAAAVNLRGSLVWVGDDNSVRMSSGGQPRIMSDSGLSEQIRKTPAADLSATFYEQDGHVCYVLHLGTTATWVLDLTNERWSTFKSLGYDYWRPRLIANLGDAVLVTDRNSNQVWTLEPDALDDAGTAFQTEFYAFVTVDEGRVPLANVVLDCLLGSAPASVTDPTISVQVSRDEGASWSSPRERSLGATGVRNVKPRWNALGQVEAPGAILKFSTAAAVVRRFSGVRANVA